MIFVYGHCVAVSVADGDTFWADIDMGLRVHVITKVRVRGCNAPELASKPAGPDARDFLLALMPPGTPVILTAHAWSHDRIVCDVTLPGEADDDLAAMLIKSGHAVPEAP